MRKLLKIGALLSGLLALIPQLAHAAGEKADELIVVADTRVLNNSIMLYFADLYNTNILLFAVWAVVLTAIYGVFLGLLMDFIMARTGLDLSKRKIVEH
ncbi:MAG: DVU0150 family protein [Pseudomonadota bacterium]